MPTILDFRLGDVFDPDNELSRWICTLSLAHNDIVTATVHREATKKLWDWFYFTRVGIGHYNEALR
jgi:hypothetical protein